MSHSSDSVFWKNFSLLVGALVALALVLFIIAQIMGAKVKKESTAKVKDKAAQEQAVAERIQPVGQLKLASDTATKVMNTLVPAANAAANGKATYESSCKVCHATGVANSPKLGDKAAWKDRIARGQDALYQNAIKGFQGKVGFMPAKGGNAGLSDADVKAAVDYMADAVK